MDFRDLLQRVKEKVQNGEFISKHGVKKSPKIVRTDAEQSICDVIYQLRELGAEVVELNEFGMDEETLCRHCEGADVILHCYTPITRKVMESAGRREEKDGKICGLRGIVKYGVGIDKIDLDAAREMGIPVANVPYYGDQTVAEGTFALLISLTRKTKLISKTLEKKGWAWPTEDFLGTDLHNKVIGMVGFGSIARRFAVMCSGFRPSSLLSYDPHVTSDVMSSFQTQKIESLSNLMISSDIIAVFASLNPSSFHLINEEMIKLMQPHALLINTARGALVDEEALVKAVLENRIGGIGIDVFSQEPVTCENHLFSPLLTHDRCIFMPHFAFWTKEARERLMNETLERTLELLAGEKLTVLSNDPRLRAFDSQIVSFR
jgi:D-3-phosphoglycerate dehydrogenase / 2-oxoglutarate reductase